MASRTLRAGVLALLGAAVSVGVAVFVSGSIAPAAAQAALPAASLMAPPACTCSEAVNVSGHTMQNCMCGALQCVALGKAPATPALVCLK